MDGQGQRWCLDPEVEALVLDRILDWKAEVIGVYDNSDSGWTLDLESETPTWRPNRTKGFQFL